MTNIHHTNFGSQLIVIPFLSFDALRALSPETQLSSTGAALHASAMWGGGRKPVFSEDRMNHTQIAL